MSLPPATFLDRLTGPAIDAALWTSIMSVGGGLGEVFVNQDARMHINGQHAIPQLLEAYKRSKVLTNLLLLTSSAAGVLSYQQTKDKYWLIGSALLAAGVPYDFFLENPTIEQLKFLTLESSSERAKTLLASWGALQLGKLALAAGGATLFYWFARR